MSQHSASLKSILIVDTTIWENDVWVRENPMTFNRFSCLGSLTISFSAFFGFDPSSADDRIGPLTSRSAISTHVLATLPSCLEAFSLASDSYELDDRPPRALVTSYAFQILVSHKTQRYPSLMHLTAACTDRDDLDRWLPWLGPVQREGTDLRIILRITERDYYERVGWEVTTPTVTWSEHYSAEGRDPEDVERWGAFK